MREDIFVQEVIAKCDVLKAANLWAKEPRIRPRAWLKNFATEDQGIAAALLNKFTFYNTDLTDKLLVAAFDSLGDGLAKGPCAPTRGSLIAALSSVVITPVLGEISNPTDSGNLICRKARQVLDTAQDRIVSWADALAHAYQGGAVMFVDDFIGSGDQFLRTWMDDLAPQRSFRDAHSKSGFVPIYVSAVSTDYGLAEIHRRASEVAVCTAHVLGDSSRYRSLIDTGQISSLEFDSFIRKYAQKLRPRDSYMYKDEYILYGYKNRGLMFGFDHSIPDATLPIFWSPGIANWEPLIERK
jgi:hypothetical protein